MKLVLRTISEFDKKNFEDVLFKIKQKVKF